MIMIIMIMIIIIVIAYYDYDYDNLSNASLNMSGEAAPSACTPAASKTSPKIWSNNATLSNAQLHPSPDTNHT
jgi:hypothetical protein